jgi:archaetidylinositol phosphate synthase
MMANPPYRPAVRLHTSVLAGVERRLLVRLAAQLPAWINSDHLTAIATLAMVGAGACFWAGGRALPLVIILLAVNWFGDSLDGTLARVRRRERPRYGYYVDHVLDAVGIAVLISGLALGGQMTPIVALGFLCAYFLLNVEIALAAHACGMFRLSFWHVGPTELRILLATGVLQLMRSDTVSLFGHRWLLFDVGCAIGIAGLVITFALSALQNGAALYREERLP